MECCESSVFFSVYCIKTAMIVMCKNKKELLNKQANVCVKLLKSSVLWTGGSPKPSLTKDILHWLPRELLLREQGCSTCLPRRWRSLRNTGIEARKWMNSFSVLFYEERRRSRQETGFLKTSCLLCSLFWATNILHLQNLHHHRCVLLMSNCVLEARQDKKHTVWSCCCAN